MASNKSMETQASHDDNTSEHEESDSELSSSENSSEEEIDPWTALMEDVTSIVREQCEKILQVLAMGGHDVNYEAKQDAIEKILPVFQKELGDVYMIAWHG